MQPKIKILNVFSYKEQVSRSNSWGHHFLFLNILLSILIGSVYVYAAPHTDSFISFIYLIITWLGQMSFLAFLIYLIILFPLSFIGNYHLYKWLSIIIAIIAFTLLLVDAKMFLSARVHISFVVLSLIFGDLDFKTGLNYNFLWIAVPLLIAFEILFDKLSTREIYRSKLRHNHFPTFVAVFLTIAFITSHSIHIWADATHHEDINILRPVFPAHYPMTAKSFLSNHGWINTNNNHNSKTIDIALKYPLEPINIDEELPKRSVVVVYINGISFSDINESLMPNIYKLKEKSQSFENYYLPYNNLEDNIFALSYGLPIQYRNAALSKRIAPVIVDEMHRQEYLVRLISDKHLLNSSEFNGFRNNNIDILNNDNEVITKACEYIKNIHKKRHFALRISLNNLVSDNLSDEEREKNLKNIDNLLPSFIQTLKENERLDDTLIIITSAIGNPKLENSDNIYNRRVLHVPLLICWPNEELNGDKVDMLTSAFDIPATIGRRVLGISNQSATYSLGTSISDSSQIRDFFVTTSGNKLLLVSKDAVTVYDDNGSAFIEDDDHRLKIRPNLKNLIRAMQDLNRFKD